MSPQAHLSRVLDHQRYKFVHDVIGLESNLSSNNRWAHLARPLYNKGFYPSKFGCRKMKKHNGKEWRQKKEWGPGGCVVMRARDTRVQEGGKLWLITFKQRKGGNFWRRLWVLAALVLSRSSCGVWSGELKMRWGRHYASCPIPLTSMSIYQRMFNYEHLDLKNNFIVFFCFATL